MQRAAADNRPTTAQAGSTATVGSTGVLAGEGLVSCRATPTIKHLPQHAADDSNEVRSLLCVGNCRWQPSSYAQLREEEAGERDMHWSSALPPAVLQPVPVLASWVPAAVPGTAEAAQHHTGWPPVNPLHWGQTCCCTPAGMPCNQKWWDTNSIVAHPPKWIIPRRQPNIVPCTCTPPANTHGHTQQLQPSASR